MPEREAAAYRGVRERTTAMIKHAPADALEATAPATPEWRVRDVLAHLVGVTVDVAEGRMDGVATEPWTEAQVVARRERAVDDVLAEWDDYGVRFEATLLAMPDTVGGQAVFDAVTHEADIRHALGNEEDARTSDAVEVAFDFCCFAREAGAQPALTLVTERGETVAGAGEPVAKLETSQFEFVRASSGRRSGDEIAAYHWDGRVDPAVMLIAPIFTLRTSPLAE